MPAETTRTLASEADQKPAAMRIIAQAIDNIGLSEFPQIIGDLCLRVSGFDSVFISAFFQDDRPLEIYDDLNEDQTRKTIIPYVDFAYLLDPFYDLFKAGAEDGVVLLSECAPDDFRSTEYYRVFYADTGLLDECGLIVRFGPEACLLISLGSRDERIRMKPETRQALEHVLPVVASLCRRHWPKLVPASPDGKSRLGHHVDKSFDRFGSSVLSGREAEIVRLILKGHSSKSMARLLGNSPETVKVHRKRIYSKLGIASQGELFSIFLDALSRTPSNAEIDPLSFLPGAFPVSH